MRTPTPLSSVCSTRHVVCLSSSWATGSENWRPSRCLKLLKVFFMLVTSWFFAETPSARRLPAKATHALHARGWEDGRSISQSVCAGQRRTHGPVESADAKRHVPIFGRCWGGRHNTTESGRQIYVHLGPSAVGGRLLGCSAAFNWRRPLYITIYSLGQLRLLFSIDCCGKQQNNSLQGAADWGRVYLRGSP